MLWETGGAVPIQWCVSVPPLELIDDLASFAICGPQSIVTNAIVNAKIESKKLMFGPTKCFNIHLGRDKTSCEGLKVHEENINEKEYETYLGDIICAKGSNQKNIEKRVNLGIGVVGEIISMLRQISLGHFYYEIDLILRDSSLVSKMILNEKESGYYRCFQSTYCIYILFIIQSVIWTRGKTW